MKSERTGYTWNRQLFLKISFSFVLLMIFLELGIRISDYYSILKIPVIIPAREVLAKTWYAPHPYLIYRFKPNQEFIMSSRRIKYPELSINKYGYRSSLEFDVKSLAKPPNTIRVVTLDGSTTMGVNNDDKVWPYFLGKILKKTYSLKKVEILNEGVMGYTSIDNLIDLSIRIIDFPADIYVLYLGVNDFLATAPLHVYKSDHSHFRKTFYQNILYTPLELIPEIILRSRVVQQVLWNLGFPDRRILLQTTGTSQFRNEIRTDKNALEIVWRKIGKDVIRNLKSMIAVIRSSNPKAIIVFCHPFFETISISR